MSDPRPGAAAPADGKSTWVVLCPGADGRPRSEYVVGTEVQADRTAGALRILDGGQVVREYSAGAWSNFCEWVSAYTDSFAASAFRLMEHSRPDERPPTEAERLLAGAMRMDTGAALTMLGAARARPERTSDTDGVVRAPTRLPGPRHAEGDRASREIGRR